MKNGPAIFALTKKGAQKAALLHSKMGGDLYLPEKFRGEVLDVEAEFFPRTASELVEDLFLNYRKIIGFCALGALVRLIAPFLKDKTRDPAVVALDEAARFSISVASGHIGGGNDLAREVAEILGAVPVITTASDVSHVLAVDLLGREYGWKVEKQENLTRVSAVVVNGGKVAIVQTCGEIEWREDLTSSTNAQFYDSLEDALNDPPEALLVITDRLVEGEIPAPLAERTVIYRPQTIVAGVGCNKGTPPEELEQVVLETLEASGLSWKSLRALATIDVKKGEAAVEVFFKKYEIPVFYYSAARLNQVPGVPNPSPKAEKYVGAQGVAEPSAMLGAGADVLLREKVKKGNVTVALARKAPPIRPVFFPRGP